MKSSAVPGLHVLQTPPHRVLLPRRGMNVHVQLLLQADHRLTDKAVPGNKSSSQLSVPAHACTTTPLTRERVRPGSPVVHVSRQLTVSAGELLTGEADELEWLRWVESAELGGRRQDVS